MLNVIFYKIFTNIIFVRYHWLKVLRKMFKYFADESKELIVLEIVVNLSCKKVIYL